MVDEELAAWLCVESARKAPVTRSCIEAAQEAPAMRLHTGVAREQQPVLWAHAERLERRH